MTTWTAGMRITADRLNDATSITVTSGVTVNIPASWALNSYQANFVHGMVTIQLQMGYSGGTFSSSATGGLQIAGDGNITDLTIATLPAGHRPMSRQYAQVSRQTVEVMGGYIDTDGSVTLTAFANTQCTLASGQAVNICASYNYA